MICRPPCASRLFVVLSLLLLDLAPSPASARAEEERPDNSAWAGVHARDEKSVETELVEEEGRRSTGGRRTTRPFTISVPNGGKCTMYRVGYADGRQERSEDPKSSAPGLFDRDEEPGQIHSTFRVDPTTIDPATGRWERVITERAVCKPIPGAKAAPPGRSLATRQISDLYVLPDPRVGVSPSGTGITGLPVRLWAEGVTQGPLQFPPTTLNGRQIEVEAWPLSFAWDTGDTGTTAPQSSYSTQTPGSAQRPAVEHVYETKSSLGRPDEGVYAITLTVTWARRYRVVGIPDPCNAWCDLDPGETRASRQYRVDEVRAVLTG